MKKVCVIGNGYVGQSMVKLFEGRCDLLIKEIDDDYTDVNNADAAIVCVPTEMKMEHVISQ